MPKIYITDIKAFLDEDKYYCTSCGVNEGLTEYVGNLLMEENMGDLLDKDTLCYCDVCGDLITVKNFNRVNK